jgi:hypothetical protein
MLAFLPPSSYEMTLYGKIYSKNAHGSGSLIPKMEGILNIFLIFSKSFYNGNRLKERNGTIF